MNFNSAKSSPGEWFTCLNVGDDKIIDKDSRRKDSDLLIPGHSLIEIVGIRTLNADTPVFEIRLPVGDTAAGQTETADEDGNFPKYVTNGINFAFTGPKVIPKGHMGRIKYAPAFVRYEGDASDNEKIFGRYVRPENSRLSDATLDNLEQLYGTGTVQQLIGDPAGHLKLPNDLTKASRFKIQHQLLGWNVHGIYKLTTGVKKEDKDSTKNLLAFVAPANQLGPLTPVRFITHEPYSTFTVRSYGSTSYDYDADNRAGQEYYMMVDGEVKIPCSLFYWDPDGNSKQMIEIKGDSINAEIKLVLEGYETEPFSLLNQYLTESSLTTLIENLPNVGKGNVSVSLWPGHWLIEFIGDLAGVVFDQFEIDRPEDAEFEGYAYYTNWADSRVDDDVLFPIPLAGQYDGDDNVINDAIAAGSIGWANYTPGVGLVAPAAQCRQYNGDGTPNL
tara:strand:+ start:9694 stop:11031 length:1338 start_codon:yes stop_codon:yes gene_type:complete